MFFSHSTHEEDRSPVGNITAELRQAGLKTSESGLETVKDPAQVEMIRDVIMMSDEVLFLVTPASFAHPNTQLEMALVHAMRRDVVVIPDRIERDWLPPFAEEDNVIEYEKRRAYIEDLKKRLKG